MLGSLVCVDNEAVEIEKRLSGLEQSLREASQIKMELPERNGHRVAHLSAVPLPEVPRTPTGRVKKGESEKVILAALNELPSGQGFTLNAIKDRTGVPHSTAYRVLKKFEHDGLLKLDGSVWMLAR